MRLAIAVLIVAIWAAGAFAAGWEPVLSSHRYGPERIVAVDKDSQTVIMLERKSPLREVNRYPCTTGQSIGDKLVEGDLRTPEGVYFVGSRINRSLDWGLYGNLAYSLNYPNPIDKIKGKTGSGIWLHGRGKELVPRDTRGCVALKVPDLQGLEQNITYGTPVVIASDLEWTQETGESELVATEVVDRLQSWAGDWQGRTDSFFDYYDPALLAVSEGLNFKGFVANKKNIFAAKPWIHVMVDNVQAIPGPDYWVTVFDQYYRTAGKVSTVGKRFYWKRSQEGDWRIVGREYVPATEDLGPKYLAAKTEELLPIIEDWKRAWLSSDIDTYMTHYASGAVQGRRKGVSRIAEYKKTLWANAAPARVQVDRLRVVPHPRGLRVAFVQTYEDASGYSDVGIKTLVMAPEGNTWKIESEQWRRGK